jgi:nucleoside-triphosphatase
MRRVHKPGENTVVEDVVRIAVTGAPGCGKTTLVRRVVERIGDRLAAGGIYTEEIRSGGSRTGFEIVSIATGQRGLLARADLATGPRIGRYRVSLRGIEEIAIPAIERAAYGADLVVIDEIAPMELTSPRFADCVEALLGVPRPLLFAIHRKARGPLLARIRKEFRVHEVTPANRDELVVTVAGALLAGGGD